MKKCSWGTFHAATFEVPLTRVTHEFRRSGVAEGWNTFWYTPVDPTLLGVIRDPDRTDAHLHPCRVGIGPRRFFRGGRLDDRDLVDVVETNPSAYPSHFGYSLWWLVPPRWIWPAYAVMMLVLALFTVGLWMRSHVGSVACGRDLVHEPRSRSPVRPGQAQHAS